MTQDPTEFLEARNLLKDFENAKGMNEDSLNILEHAFGILEDLVSENPNPEFRQKTLNLKKTYIKFLIKKLEQTDFNFYSWSSTLIIILSKFDDEIKELLRDAPELKKSYSDFMNQQPWRDDLIKILKKNS